MPRLRRADPSKPGLTRLRRGRGFSYVDATGARVTDPETLARIDALAIPPAWRDVWICPRATGHIQAVGTDAAGRRQYRYHDEWRTRQDAIKHERVLDFAEVLPKARPAVEADLAGRGFTRRRVLAAAFRLLDLGLFRVGSEEYAADNESFGLATLRKEHVRTERGALIFDYPAKGGRRRVVKVGDDAVRAVVLALRRAHGSEELLAYREGAGGRGPWRDVTSAEVNDYVREVTGGDFTAKDFRTWHATVLAALALAVVAETCASPTARRRAVARACSEVADYLGNTAAVARASYIDPRVIERFNEGVTIEPALAHLGADVAYGQPATHGTIEAAVLDLLRD